MRSPAAWRWTRSWPRCTARRKAAAAGAAARCTSSTLRTRFYGGNAIVGGGLPLAVGLALADKMQQARTASPPASLATVPSPRASFTRASNLAELWRLPVLFVCENNLYAMGTALERSRSRRPTSTCKAQSYNVPAEVVDGMDVVAVEAAARRVCAGDPRAVAGRHFLECRTYRFRAHSMFDAAALSRQGRDRGLEASRSDRPPQARWMRETGTLHDDGPRPRSRPKSRPRSSTASPSPRAGSWEPVAELTRDVYAAEGCPSERRDVVQASRSPTARRSARRSARRCWPIRASS